MPGTILLCGGQLHVYCAVLYAILHCRAYLNQLNRVKIFEEITMFENIQYARQEYEGDTKKKPQDI